MRLTIVQYGGDYREAWERFERGGAATYQAQRYSIDFVGSLAQRLEQVAVICAVTEDPYDEVLPNKVRSIGAGLSPGFHPNELLPLLSRSAPDRLVLVTPMLPLLRWARRNQIRTLTTLADSFQPGGLRAHIRHWRLAHELNQPSVEWTGNHGIGACLSLLRIGVRPDKIVPWDWPPSHRPYDYAPRLRDSSKPLSLIFVGAVTESKGVGDVLRALHQLRSGSVAPTLTVVGRDHDGNMHALANSMGLGEQVRFAGLVPNEEIPLAMRAADVVVIPSRHDYPEGLPLTIYEALSSRTPIIASDHPMFIGALTNEQSALIFPAGNTDALASVIRRLGSDADLYAKLSLNSEAAWRALQLPVTWGALIEHWLSDVPDDANWIKNYRLTSGLYDEQIAARSQM
jgi:glycosyltransferase involved in cell wall biosynthesis